MRYSSERLLEYRAYSYLYGPAISGWILPACRRGRAFFLEASNETYRDGFSLAIERPTLKHNKKARQDMNVRER